MALINFSQAYAIHGANKGGRVFTAECTGNVLQELYSNVRDRILNGSLLYKLCPGLKPGDSVKVYNRDALGNVVPSGYSYTVIAGDNDRPNGTSDNYIYAIPHKDDEILRFHIIPNLGDDFSHSIYVPNMSLFSMCGGVLLDENNEVFQLEIKDGTDTNDIDQMGAGHGFTAHSPRGSQFECRLMYYANKFIVRNDFPERADKNKRFVLYYTFKPKDYVELTYANNNVRKQNHSALTDFVICGELAKAYVQSSYIGDNPTDASFRLKNETYDASMVLTWGDPAFTPVTTDGRIFKGTILSWVQTRASARTSCIGGYVKCFFNPVP